MLVAWQAPGEWTTISGLFASIPCALQVSLIKIKTRWVRLTGKPCQGSGWCKLIKVPYSNRKEEVKLFLFIFLYFKDMKNKKWKWASSRGVENRVWFQQPRDWRVVTACAWHALHLGLSWLFLYVREANKNKPNCFPSTRLSEICAQPRVHKYKNVYMVSLIF